MISKSRLDALTDGVFAVAMTLLVIDLRPPEGFEPKSAWDLLVHLGDLRHQLLVYVVSFYVLASRWHGMVRIEPRAETASDAYTKWALLHMLLVTFVPFATIIVGRYARLPPAIWLYAGTIILISLVALRMMSLAEPGHKHSVVRENQLGLVILIAVSVIAIAASFLSPRWAIAAYALNFLDKPIRRRILKRTDTDAPSRE